MLMPELLANYSEGMALTNKTKCLSAGVVFSCLTFTAVFNFPLQPLASFCCKKMQELHRCEPLTTTAVDGTPEFLITV